MVLETNLIATWDDPECSPVQQIRLLTAGKKMKKRALADPAAAAMNEAHCCQAAGSHIRPHDPYLLVNDVRQNILE